jgi:tellurite methyltransferase
MASSSVNIFDEQFRRQVADGDFALNPFEIAALEQVQGSLLDLGCGLGNLSLAAARRGHSVLAVDASPAAIARIQAEAARSQLPIQAEVVDLDRWQISTSFDTIAAIGILTYFPRPRAEQLLRALIHHTKPGGRLILNSLIEGTTFFDLFDGDHYCLFQPGELAASVEGWSKLYSKREEFEAPGGKIKLLETVIAEKPAG